MHEPDAVHPRDGAAQLGPDALEDGLAEARPRGVGVDEREEVAAREEGEDEHVVRGRGEVREERGDVRVRDVLCVRA